MENFPLSALGFVWLSLIFLCKHSMSSDACGLRNLTRLVECAARLLEFR